MKIELENCVVINEELALAFSDQVECYIPLKVLRDACPCALCQGESDALGKVYKVATKVGVRGYELDKVELVGGYAIRPHWGDRHDSGMYSYALLRSIAAAGDL